MTGLSRGFGFVHFPTAAQAQAGLVALNNSDLAGRHIYVRVRAAKGACRGAWGLSPQLQLRLGYSNDPKS